MVPVIFLFFLSALAQETHAARSCGEIIGTPPAPTHRFEVYRSFLEDALNTFSDIDLIQRLKAHGPFSFPVTANPQLEILRNSATALQTHFFPDADDPKIGTQLRAVLNRVEKQRTSPSSEHLASFHGVHGWFRKGELSVDEPGSDELDISLSPTGNEFLYSRLRYGLLEIVRARFIYGTDNTSLSHETESVWPTGTNNSFIASFRWVDEGRAFVYGGRDFLKRVSRKELVYPEICWESSMLFSPSGLYFCHRVRFDKVLSKNRNLAIPSFSRALGWVGEHSLLVKAENGSFETWTFHGRKWSRTTHARSAFDVIGQHTAIHQNRRTYTATESWNDVLVQEFDKHGRRLRQFPKLSVPIDTTRYVIALSPDGNLLALGSYDQTRLYILSIPAGLWSVFVLSKRMYGGMTVQRIAFTPDSKGLLAEEGGTIGWYDISGKR